MITWIIRILYSFDQFVNALLYPFLNLLLGKGSYKFGHPDETLSSVMGKNIRTGHCKGCYFICKILNRIEFWRRDDHCERSIEEDEHIGFK